MKFINNTMPLALASLCISFAADQEVVPQGNCNFLKQAQCAVAASSIVADITTLPIPPSLEELKAVLVNGNAFFDNCKECLYESQTNLICVTIDRVVTESSKTLKIDVDFHLESCKKEGVIGAIKDTLGSIGSLLPFTEENIVDDTTKALVDFGIDQSEARSIAEENLSLLSGEIVNPIKDGCVKVDFDFFKIVGHEGSVCGYDDGVNSGVTVKGAFSVLGNTLVTYNERFDKNKEFCLSTFNVVAFQMRPCIQVNTDRR